MHAAPPGNGQVTGLLALMLLTEARRPARTGADGELVPLAEQDRALWDQQLITEGVALAVRDDLGLAGDYQIQAAIATRHYQARQRRRHRPAGDPAPHGILERWRHR